MIPGTAIRACSRVAGALPVDSTIRPESAEAPGILRWEVAFQDRSGTCQKSVLDNGIRVVTQAMAGARSVSMAVLAEAGPQQEGEHQAGLAHLVEHAMFLGTGSRDAAAIARWMDMGGGSMGAFTSRDYTCYFATVLDDYRTYALDLLGDILLNSVFPAESLERAKATILHEINGSRDAPEERVHDLLKETAWAGHPLGRPVCGHPQGVAALTREDVIYFVHRFYLPDRLIVAAAGNLEHRDFVAQVRDAFWRLLGESEPVPHRPAAHRPGLAMEPMALSQTYFCLGLPAPRYDHPQRYALHLIDNVLGGGISSRLYRRLREDRGLAYRISSTYHAYRDAGMLVIQGSTAPKHVVEGLALACAELRALAACREPIGAEELWKAKMHLRGQHLLAGEDTHTRMSRLATQELYFGRAIPEAEVLAQIDALDPDGVGEETRAWLSEALKDATLAVVGPEAVLRGSRSELEQVLADCRSSNHGGSA
jgi:predicted Zn-dependent peptidase